jgi:hypothetical protein
MVLNDYLQQEKRLKIKSMNKIIKTRRKAQDGESAFVHSAGQNG